MKDDLGRPQGRYPESFVLISLLEACQEWGVKKGGTWRMLRVPDQRYDIIYVLDRPQGYYPESFMSLYCFYAEIWEI